MTRRDVRAVEIGGDDYAWLRGRALPDGIELADIEEVEFWGETYERPEGSLLYMPVEADVTERVVDRVLARAEAPPAPIGVSLFTGAGGFDLGMHEAGIDVVAANEWDAAAAHTYLLNLARPDCAIRFASDKDRRRWEKYRERVSVKQRKSGEDPDAPWMGTAYRAASGMTGGCRAFFFGDISQITGAQIMDAAGVDRVDVVFGGPPCQGLSNANAKACLEDPRNGLLWEFMRMVDEIRPKSFVIENVPGLLHVANGALFNALAQIANDAGYDVVATKLNAVEFGVPQYRLRAIVVGTLEDVGGYRYPMPTHWAMGRPVNDRGWVTGDGASHERSRKDRVYPRLPAQAKFDPASRRWSFTPEQPKQPDEKPVEGALDLFAEGAA